MIIRFVLSLVLVLTASTALADVPAASGGEPPKPSTQLLSTVRVMPYDSEGESIGLRLFAIRAQSYWERAGFKNGDILLEVDGAAVTSAQDFIAIAERLSGSISEEHRFKIERDLAKKEIVYRDGK